MWDVAVIERRAGRDDAALALLTELAAARNPYRVRAFEEIAKHYEHREKNYAMALEMTRNALLFADTPEIRRREDRLKARLARPQAAAVGVIGVATKTNAAAEAIAPAAAAGRWLALEPDADQGLQNAGIAERAGSGCVTVPKPVTLNVPLALRPSAVVEMVGKPFTMPLDVGVSVEIQRAVIAREVRVVEDVEGVHAELEVNPAILEGKFLLQPRCRS